MNKSMKLTSYSREQMILYRATINMKGEVLHGCDVCWTCERFDMMNVECSLNIYSHHSEYKNILDYVKNQCGVKFDPAWFRCSYWKG